MLSEWPGWISRYPAVRRPAIKLWRVLLRVQRATFANAVLVVRKSDGRVLVLPSSSGNLRLPVKQLHAWGPIPTQVEEWLEQLLHQRSTPSLVAIDGTPGQKGVTFLYAAILEAPMEKGDALWLEPDVAASGLGGNDSRLLLFCANRQEGAGR
jgi:hypothetical protein